MRLTIDNVRKLLGDIDTHCLEISESDNGIRIFKEEWDHDSNIIGSIMKAALALRLSPNQVIINIENEEGAADTQGYGFIYITIDVTFLHSAPEGQADVS